ncbi:poly(A) polymerase, putative [Trypanosoma cruzi]|uniref:polynucleotide adenylyltransferase n=1 Tax=Trypanosoma cruzi (strain CL Brener) TaxID=353153 RepID=Q4E647_TRYCC|nr:poly(A) polymerase, putative [Trypanosoma cruzi]EAO00212.1 poly(A) polymerase, putative [Trypanosoma cruzi]|eukprot:XP_822063.1 poly(A) polymerase [Trypanosoma cruzi strain CL Brener]
MELLYGPTKPLEVPPAQPRDLAESKRLCETMATVVADRVREAIDLIELTAHRLVDQITAEPEERWVRAYPFGSCGLGASVADSDLDIVLFCSFKVTAEVFFREFPPLLQPVVGNVVLVPARVPVVKFSYSGTSVDVVFVSAALAAPPTTEQLLDDSFLLQVARDTRHSVNGLRTVLEVKRRLPVAYDVFTTVLKSVKLWAMRRKVYGNLYCYPSGVVLAIMVARICQVMPASHPNVLLRFFFLFYTQWLSRHDRISPVYITTSLESRGRIPGLPDSWDPRRDACRDDLLPVINPAYPYVNDARNVGRCSLEVFYAELTYAYRLLSNLETPLEAIWEPYHILDDYSTFFVVHVTCEEENEEKLEAVLSVWSSYVLSKLRILLYALERIVDARPYPQKLNDGPPRSAPKSGRFLKGSCFIVGIKEKVGRRFPQKNMFFEAFDELRYAVLEECNATKSVRGFERDERTMHEPWFALVSAADLLPILKA